MKLYIKWFLIGILISIVNTAQSQPMGPPVPHEGVMLSLARFEALFTSSTQRSTHAKWHNPRLEIDVLKVKQTGEAWVTFTADVDVSDVPVGINSVTLDLVALTVHPLSVSQKGTILSPKASSSFHQVELTIEQAANGSRKIDPLRLRYPVRLSQHMNGEISGLIPLPPVANAEVRVIGKGNIKFIPELGLNQAQVASDVPLRGALAVLISPTESGALLQSKNLDVQLHSSGEGADVKAILKTLLRGGALHAWIPISPSSNALLNAIADGKPAITDVRDGWHMVWVDGAGPHTIQTHTRVKVDRSSGQPRLTLSPQSAPRSRLSLKLSGEREVISEPLVPMVSQIGELTSSSTDETEEKTNKETRITADLPPLQQLTIRWTEKRVTPEEESPEFLSETYQLFSLQEGLLKGQAQLELDIIKGELKHLSVKIPKDVVLYHLSGVGVENWVTLPSTEGQNDEQHKIVRVTFGEPRSGKNMLSIKWQRVLSNNESLTMPLIQPLGAFQESGVIALFDGDRVGFTPAQAQRSDRGEERLIPVGQESIPQRILQLKSGEKVSQAFRHVQAPTNLKTSTTTERARELRFDARLDTLYSLRDGAVRAQSQLLLNLKSGRLESLIISLPKECSEPQVSGPSINRVEPLPNKEGKASILRRYEVKFTRRLEGAITLNIDAEQLISSETATLVFPRVIVEGAELTQGHIGLTAEAGLEVSPAEINELRRVTLDELPRSISLRAATEVLYGYRFSRGWSLSAALKRHKIIETLSAEAIELQVQSYLLESGQRVDLARYVVENRDRRIFKLTLPLQSNIQEVLVNKQPVRARAEGKQISIPIPKNRSSQVQVRYEVTRDFDQLDQYELSMPSSDLRTTNITWDIFFSDQRQLWSWYGELSEKSGSAIPMDSMNSFHSLGSQARFHYDLLSANRSPLKINLSLRGVISHTLVNRLMVIGFFGLLVIGFRRGLLLVGKVPPMLRYAEMVALSIIAINLGVLLYQGSAYELEHALIFTVQCLLLVSGGTWLMIRIYQRVSALFHRWSVAKSVKKVTKRDDQSSVNEDSSSSEDVSGQPLESIQDDDDGVSS